MKKTIFTLCLFVSLTFSAQEITTNSNPVGLKHNLLFNASNTPDQGLFAGTDDDVWKKSGTNISYQEGNVGIGMPASGFRLDVNGLLRANDQIYIEGSGENGIGGKLSLTNNGKKGSNEAKQWTIYNMSGDYGNSLQFWAYDNASCPDGLCASRFTIMDNGNVGIGCSRDPQYKLDVAGIIRAHEIKVELNAGADHVFNPGYELMPLAEVQSFINTNRHLPDIQSEKDMIENGVNMNEFQIKLLQKIEELTLYLLEQQKEIDELKLQLKDK